MLRSDKLGITFVICDLALSRLLSFHAALFQGLLLALDTIRHRWFRAVKDTFPLYKQGNFHILAGDGVKQSKEGRRMPGVKRLCGDKARSQSGFKR